MELWDSQYFRLGEDYKYLRRSSFRGSKVNTGNRVMIEKERL